MHKVSVNPSNPTPDTFSDTFSEFIHLLRIWCEWNPSLVTTSAVTYKPNRSQYNYASNIVSHLRCNGNFHIDTKWLAELQAAVNSQMLADRH